eukprot:3901180-Amphidinium_carterae.1
MKSDVATLKKDAIAALKREALSFLQQKKPSCKARTAVGMLVDSYPFGLYTKQGGAGITSNTFEYPDLVQCVHLAAECLGIGYTSFVVNLMLPGSSVDWHQDLSNFANAVNAVLQFNVVDAEEYQGGELQLLDDHGKLTTVSGKKGKWITFCPHSWHRITQVFNGARISVVLFTAGGLHRVAEPLWMKLRSLKFPVSHLRSEAVMLRKDQVGPLGAKW